MMNFNAITTVIENIESYIRPVPLDTPALLNELYDLLEDVVGINGEVFSGTGLIIVKDEKSIDHFSMFDVAEQWLDQGVSWTLKDISKMDSPYHDGFHLLDATLQPVKYCTYICPKINLKVAANIGERLEGSRAYTALLSTLMPNVLCSAIAHCDGTIRLFLNGRELHTLPESEEKSAIYHA